MATHPNPDHVDGLVAKPAYKRAVEAAVARFSNAAQAARADGAATTESAGDEEAHVTRRTSPADGARGSVTARGAAAGGGAAGRLGSDGGTA